MRSLFNKRIKIILEYLFSLKLFTLVQNILFKLVAFIILTCIYKFTVNRKTSNKFCFEYSSVIGKNL